VGAEGGGVPDAAADAATLYRRYGFSPIPFYRGTKRPAVGKGAIGHYRQRRASVAQLKRWFAGGEHSIGLVTGAVSRLLVLDIDPRNGGDRSVRGLPMPPTPTVLTPDGRHAYFRHAGGLPTRLKALPGVDILGEKWQVLAPHRAFTPTAPTTAGMTSCSSPTPSWPRPRRGSSTFSTPVPPRHQQGTVRRNGWSE
jgi:Bifunctional DNA primase/polymerase, N-terminal